MQSKHFDALHLLGVIALQTNHMAQAAELIGRAIQVNPNDAAAYTNRGVALKELRRLDDALACFEKAIALKPDFPSALSNQGLVLQELKRLDEALVCYEKAIALNPDFAFAHNNRGFVLHELKRVDEALASYDKAIALKPDYAEAFGNRGAALQHLQRFDEALACHDKAIALRPDYAEAFCNRGDTLHELKRLDEALVCYDKAIALKPGYADAHGNAGIVLRDLNRLGEALVCFDKAIALKPDYAQAFNNRGHALHDLKRLDEALASYDAAIALKPGYAEALGNRGVTLHALKRSDEALASYDKAIVLKPDYAEAFSNRGTTLHDLNRLDEAMACYDRAIALHPDVADTYWNKSLLHLLQADFSQGWALYEWRLKKDDVKNEYQHFPDKLAWRGQSSLQGKTLLIQCEQGMGDVIQFCRYVPRLQDLGAKLLFEVPKPLLSLLATLACDATLVEKGSQLPHFDAYCPAMSLPMVCKTELATVPNAAPYLFSDPQKVTGWQQCLGPKTKPRIGLVWSGNEKHKNDANRSIGLEAIVGLASLPVEFHSLQKEYRESDKEALKQHSWIALHHDELKDFSDTAALVACMDLVISVDTSVAHVAGALGKPVWILLPYMPDYRWMLDRKDSPWYPTAVLYRQDQSRGWDSVMERVKYGVQHLTA